MMRDTIDVAEAIAAAIRKDSAGEADARYLRDLGTIPAAHSMQVDTVEGKRFFVLVSDSPLFRAVLTEGAVDREGAAEHVANALQILRTRSGSAHPSATDAVAGAIARLELALTDLGATP